MKKIWLVVALSLTAVANGCVALGAPLKAIVGATVVNVAGGAPIENAVVDFPGPRVFTAGGVTMTAGHGSRRGVTYNDGPYEMVKTARSRISDGQDWIKIAISGGVATAGGGIAEALMTPQEMRAIIDAAHRFNIPVAAHSGSTAATNAAVDAGIDSIEHGYALDRPLLKKMVKSDTWLVPTIMVTHPGGREYFQRIGSPQWYLERCESIGKRNDSADTLAWNQP